MSVVSARLGDQMFKNINWRAELARDVQALYESAHKSLEIPSLLADALRTALKGEANVGLEHHAGSDLARLIRETTLRLCAALLAAALLICGGLLREAVPLAGGLSWYSVICFLAAVAVAVGGFMEKPRKKKK